MAVFRAITAEEEAVSGVFHALKYRNYKNADLINPRNHVHKSAAIPFLQVLGLFFHEFSETEKIAPKLHIKDEDGETRLRVALSVKINSEDLLAYPIPPLNFSVTSDGKKPSFKPQIGRFLTDKNSSDILKFVQEQANLRNKILYASTDGYPAITELQDEFFEVRRSRVMAMVLAFLLIEPWNESQLFVQQSLDAFLVMLNRVEDEMLHTEV